MCRFLAALSAVIQVYPFSAHQSMTGSSPVFFGNLRSSGTSWRWIMSNQGLSPVAMSGVKSLSTRNRTTFGCLKTIFPLQGVFYLLLGQLEGSRKIAHRVTPEEHSA